MTLKSKAGRKPKDALYHLISRLSPAENGQVADEMHLSIKVLEQAVCRLDEREALACEMEAMANTFAANGASGKAEYYLKQAAIMRGKDSANE